MPAVQCFHLAKRIKAMKEIDVTVIFSGEGADELCGGYLYFHSAPTPAEFDSECRRLLSSLHRFDVLRAEKSLSGAGLEARVPFLDKEFVDTYLGCPATLRQTSTFRIEKGLLRESIRHMFPDLIPTNVLERKKEAFSDGISSIQRPWFRILQDKAAKHYYGTSRIDAERKYYEKLFTEKFGNRKDLIPYQWLPRWQGNIGGAVRSRAQRLYLLSLSVIIHAPLRTVTIG